MPERICTQILEDLENLKISEKPPLDLSIRNHPHEINYPPGFFDGAAQNQRFGCSAWLLITPCHYKIYWFGGIGTNMMAKALALWGLMWFANHLCIDRISIYGDSKVLIDHLNKESSINQTILPTWMNRIEILRKKFSSITFSHTFREKNSQADRLSKMGLKSRFGEMHYELFEAKGRGAKGSLIFS